MSTETTPIWLHAAQKDATVFTRICLVMVTGWLAFAPTIDAFASERLSLMFVSNHAFSQTHLDGTLRAKLAQSGLALQVDTCNYPDLTMERLSQCHLLVMTYPSGVAQKLLNAAPLILEYVKTGGGLVVLSDECAGSNPLLNEFAAKLDARVLLESPVDPATLFQQPGFLRHWFCSTGNIKPHPVTDDVKTLFYPLADTPDTGGGTQVLELGNPWTPLVFASPSAYIYRITSKEKIEAGQLAPKPILAVRDYGKGRIVLFASRSLNFLHQPYHKLFEGTCLERGDGLRLVHNMLVWTGQAALETGKLGGFVEPPRAEHTPKLSADEFHGLDYYEKAYRVGVQKPPVFPAEDNAPSSDGLKDFRGLIGARTAYSQGAPDPFARGSGTVREYCQIAKGCGYQFIVFAEIFENMTPAKWEALITECKAASSLDFIAIPGIEIKNLAGESWITVDMPRWPVGLDSSARRIESAPGYFFGACHTESVFSGHFLLAPKSARGNALTHAFYTGMEVFSYKNNAEQFSSAFDYYLKAQANQQNQIPITAHRLHNPNDVYPAGGILTRVRASSAAEIPLKFRAPWYGSRDIYLSSGPELRQWTMLNGWEGFRDEEWRLPIGIQSDVPLKSITVYDREKVYRQFLPNGRTFQTTLAGYHDAQHFFVLVAEDRDGKMLVSPARYVRDRRQSQYMCTDMQNTLNCSMDITAEGREVIYAGVGYGNYGWDGVNVFCTTPDLLPESGIELGYGRLVVQSSPFLPGLEGNNWLVCSREMPFGTGDVNINLNDYRWMYSGAIGNLVDAPSLHAVSSHTCYTPRLNGLNVFRVQQKVRLLRDFVLPAGKGAEWLTGLRINLDEKAFPKYAIVDESGHKIVADRDARTALDLSLRPGSYFASFPCMWGPLAVFPLEQEVKLKLRGSSLEIGCEVTGPAEAGTEYEIEVLFIIGRYDSLDETDYDDFRSAFGLSGVPLYRYQVKHGKALSTRYVFVVEAEDGWAAADISVARLGCDLPINVRGLNGKWDAGLLDLDSGKLRRVGVYQGQGILERDIDRKPMRFVCGNLMVCDNPEVSLNVFERNGRWSCDVHNPMQQAVKIHVRTPEWLKGFAPRLDTSLDVPAGSTATLRF